MAEQGNTQCELIARIHPILGDLAKNNNSAMSAIQAAEGSVRNIGSGKGTAFVLPSDRDVDGSFLIEIENHKQQNSE